MKLTAAIYHVDGARIMICHERPGVVFAEYTSTDDERRSKSYNLGEGKSTYMIATEILGAHASAVTGDALQAFAVAITKMARG